MDKELIMCIVMYVIIFLWIFICPVIVNGGEVKHKRSRTMESDWYDEMEKAEQEYDAREYELAQEYSRGYEQGKADATKELPTSLYYDGFNAGYRKGRADKQREITSAYMLLTEKQVAEIRADAIDELSKEIHYCLHCGMGKDKSLEHLMNLAEKLKGNSNER